MFDFRYLKSLTTQFNSTADALMEELSKIADGGTTIQMIEYLNRATLDIIGKVIAFFNHVGKE